MARASTYTWLSLERYAEIMGIHPLHFNGLYHPTLAQDIKCSNIWMQYDWQAGNRLSRESLARAIRDAELKIAQYGGYNLLSDWVSDERHKTQRGAIPELFSRGHNIRGMRKSVATKRGYVWSGGVRAVTSLELNIVPQYSDLDGDGYDETATISFTNATVALCEVHIFYRGKSGAASWEIKPITVTRSGNDVLVTCKRWQLVDFAQLEALNATGLNATAAIYVPSVDAYRVYNDPQTQLQMLWEEAACGDCGGSGCTTCELAVQAGCLTVRDTRTGIVSYSPGTWNSSTSEFDSAELSLGRDADRLRLWYYSGWRDESQTCPSVTLDPALELAIAYFATALVNREFCNCNNVKSFAEWWREDLALSNSQRSYQNGPVQLNNPFGTQRGAVYAWNVINEEERLIGR